MFLFINFFNLINFKFRQYLSYKCVEYNCQLLEITEEYTSKCCSRCRFLNDNYEKREKICPYCNLKINQDINGSRNILLKTLNEIGCKTLAFLSVTKNLIFLYKKINIQLSNNFFITINIL